MRRWWRAALLGLSLAGGGYAASGVLASDDCWDADPGDGDYCGVCGPCAEGEGDCDPGECQDGLACVEQGDVDECRAIGTGESNLQVRLDGQWRGICCRGDTPALADGDCWWTVHDRTLEDETEGRKVDCPEGGPAPCECNWSGERMHGVHGDLGSSIERSDGGPMYPNYGEETCVVVDGDGELRTDWTSSSCPDFRLR
jgi:hypothetical protein